MERNVDWLYQLLGKMYTECISLREDLANARAQVDTLTKKKSKEPAAS